MLFGDVAWLPDGDVLVNYGSSSRIERFGLEGQLLWSLENQGDEAFGFSTLYQSLDTL